MSTPTIVHGMKGEDYHAHPALGSTSLKTLATRTPAHWKWEQAHPVQKDVYDLGTVVHSLALEQDDSLVKVIDVEEKRGKVWTEPAEAARAEGKIPLKTAEWNQVRAMRDSILAHPLAGRALKGHTAEASVFWEEDGLPLKCRPDAWNLSMLFDLKTTINADPREFGRTAHNFGYHQSHAHYVDGVKELTGEELPFVFILAEKTPPYLVSVVELDAEAVALGRRLNERAKNVYRRCAETGEWPGYATAEPIRVPAWAARQTEGILE